MPGLPSWPSTVSRSTPRVRVLAAVVVLGIVLVAVADRPLATGVAGSFAAAAGFVFVAIAALGRAWTSLFIAGRKDVALVRAGPYSACRHPLYALSIVGALGLGLATRSITLLLALSAVAGLLHTRAIAEEDRWLEAAHGDAARDYRASVPALWPSRWTWHAPERLEIQPRIAWKAFLDAGTLLLALGLVQLAHGLQSTGATPTLLRLW